MTQMIFLNLPVADLARSVAFYEALGFVRNPQFSDDTAACIVVSEAIYLMLLTPGKWAQFETRPVPDTQATCGLLVALSRDSRAAVDALAQAAVAAGGVEPKPATDMGFMYTRTFRDPDGHTFEPVWMDPSAVAPA